jgi:hypothetical protein
LTKTTKRRYLIFLLVQISHVVIVLIAIRTARQLNLPASDSQQPLILLLLKQKPRSALKGSMRHATASSAGAARSKARTTRDTAQPQAVPSETLPQPPIDWQREAQLAVQNDLLNAEKQQNYRDLSALSAEQLSWIRRNHLEPAPPGITWHHHRVEFDKSSGLPMFWINDNCVIVAPLMLMVFCRIGHIEANGGLFKHMRDAHD